VSGLADGAVWESLPTRIAAEHFGPLDDLAVVHGFALRQPAIPVQVERAEAMARLAGAHAELRLELGLEERRFCTAEQVHGAEVAVVDRFSAPMEMGADGLLTRDPAVCLGIYTADCCAVFLVDPVRRAVGLLHSGAKGTRLGIAAVGIERMCAAFGSDARDLVAVLGACIRPPLYEFDFAAEIRRQCVCAGVARVYDPGNCTGSALERYYSYRMEQGKTGRMLALLALAR
jgi:hypothetical protein